MFTDVGLTTPFVNTAKIIFGGLNDASLSNFKIFTDAGLAKTTLYLQAYTEGHTQADPSKLVSLPAPIKINIYVCGGEVLTKTAAATPAQKIYEATPSIQVGYKAYDLDFRSWFSLSTTSSHLQCGIVRYWVGGCLSQFAEPVYTKTNSKFHMNEQTAILSKSGKQWFKQTKFDVLNGALANHASIESPEGCADLCEANGSCKGFRYLITDKSCNLKSVSVKTGALALRDPAKDWYEMDPIFGEFQMNVIP